MAGPPGSLFKEIEADTESRLARDEISEARANLLYQEAATAKSIRKFIDDLGYRLTPPENGSEWVAFCNWARGLLDHYLDKSLPSTETAALEKIYRSLEELKAADSVKAGTTLKEFRQTVDDALQESTGRLGVTGQGVFVSSFAAAAGMNFDAIWMVGMIEGAVPPHPTPDPLLPEADWLSAGGPSRLKMYIAQERRDYLSAVAFAPRRVLSYPAAGAASNRKAYSSRWLLEQASALEDGPIRSSDLSRLTDRPWLTIDASPEHALSRVPNPPSPTSMTTPSKGSCTGRAVATNWGATPLYKMERWPVPCSSEITEICHSSLSSTAIFL